MSFVDPFAAKSKNVEEEIFFHGQSTGLVLEIRPKHAPEVKAVERLYKDRVFTKARKGKGVDAALFEQQERDLAIAHVAGWRWKDGSIGIGGKKPPYSKESLNTFLDHDVFGPVLKESLLDVVGEGERFLEMSATQ